MANMDVFGVSNEALRYQLDDAKKTIEAPLNQSWIKQRQQGGTTLSYIGGHTVIRLLNKAFNYQWSFEVISEEVKESLPKPAFDGWGKNRKAKLDANGNQVMEPQPPVAKVLGRLTVPGIGIKEQWGSKVLIGGATEQESAFKSASTDALKKCASLLGIGLELYGEDEGMMDTDEAVEAATVVTPVATPQPQQQKEQTPPPAEPQQSAPVQQEQQAPAKQAAGQQQTSSTPVGGWDANDIQRLKDLKGILGITDNTELDPYVREFFDNPNVTWQNITPENIKAVNIFLTKKAENN